jgi:hypothetical protein
MGVKLSREGDTASFRCPGCADGTHTVQVAGVSPWSWNGSTESPTFTPSVLVKSGHYAFPDGESCWCTYNAAHPGEPAPFKCGICHSFVTDGKIQFLGDCTHALAGQTVELPDLK